MRQNIREVTPMVKVTLRNLFSDDIDTNLIKKVLNYAKILDWFENIMNENLDIPIGELNRMSKMSLDYSKYGYRPYTGPTKNITVQQNRVSNELLIWENDNMNYYQAYDAFEFMLEQRNDISNGFTLAPWDLAMVGLPGNVTERLSLHNSYVKSTDVDRVREEFINNYKHKKFNI
jgi:D-mannonate dehydratase